MIKTPKISIVTPSLNQGKFLEKTIISILSQNYPNLEYIIMDGGSTDESVNIIKKYSNKITYWESSKDEGQWDAINKGFKKSTGDVMTWLNSDDILMPGTLGLVANIFNQAGDINWVSGVPTTINQEGIIVHTGLRPAYARSLIELGFYHGAGLGFIMQEGTFWRKSLWEQSGKKIECAKLSLDYKLWKNFAKYSDLTPIFANLAAFRLNPNRKTRNFNSYFREIGIPFPKLFRLLFLPIRFLFHQILRISIASSRISFSQKDQCWHFIHGWLDGVKCFSKPKKIINRKL